MSWARKDGSTYYAYTVTGSNSEIEEYIRVATTCKEYPQPLDKVVSEDGSPTFFTNKLVPSEHNEVFLSEKWGPFTRNSLRKSLVQIAKEIQQAEENGSSTRVLEKKEDILIAQDMEQEASAQAAMDKAMSDYREQNSKNNDDVAPKAKSKAKAKAKATVEDEDEDDLV